MDRKWVSLCHCHYGITRCYLPPDISEHTRRKPSQKPVLDLPASSPQLTTIDLFGSVNEYRLRMCDAAWCAPCTWAPMRWPCLLECAIASFWPLRLYTFTEIRTYIRLILEWACWRMVELHCTLHTGRHHHHSDWCSRSPTCLHGLSTLRRTITTMNTPILPGTAELHAGVDNDDEVAD